MKPAWPFTINDNALTRGVVGLWAHWADVDGQLLDLSASEAHLDLTDVTFDEDDDVGSFGEFNGASSVAKSDLKTHLLQPRQQGTVVAMAQPDNFNSPGRALFTRGMYSSGPRPELSCLSLVCEKHSGDDTATGDVNFWDGSQVRRQRRVAVAAADAWQLFTFRFSLGRHDRTARADIVVDTALPETHEDDVENNITEVTWDLALPHAIGAHFNADYDDLTRFFDGSIALVAVWDRWITDEERAALVADPWASLLTTGAGDASAPSRRRVVREIHGVSYTVVKNLTSERIFLPWFPSAYGDGRWIEAYERLQFAGNIVEEVAGRPSFASALQRDMTSGKLAITVCGDDPAAYEVIDSQSIRGYKLAGCQEEASGSSSSLAL